MVQAAASQATRRMTGVIADGAFKVVLAAVYSAGTVPVGRLLGVSGWLMVVSSLALLIGGGVEIGHIRSRSAHAYTRLMIAYDSGWVLAALTGLLIAWRGGSTGGEAWIGYQAVAPLVFAALLVTAARPQTPSDIRADDATH